jgi:hypothetical protein
MNNIFKFCEKKKCERNVQYNKLKTGGNDPNMSSRMLCAQRATNYSRSRSSVEVSAETCLNLQICGENYALLVALTAKFQGDFYLIYNALLQINPALAAQYYAKHNPFVCNNPVFTGGIYPSRNVSNCSCSRANLADIISGK